MLAAYLLTAPSSPATLDYAEAQTVPYILGIAHPTGFPAYVLAGWVFSHLFGLGTVAWRLNVFAALWVATAAGGVALLAAELGAGAVAALLAAWLFAFGGAAWFAGTHADAHAMLLPFLVFGLVCALRYARCGANRDLLAAALCCGLGLAIHPFALFVLVPIAVALLYRRNVSRRVALRAAVLVFVPLALYAYLPLRSAYVAAHHLDPTAAPPVSGVGAIVWDYNHPRTMHGFLTEVLGLQFDAAPALLAAANPRSLPERWLALWPYLGQELPPVGLALAVAGLLALAVRDRRALAVALSMALSFVAFVFQYEPSGIDLPRYLVPVFAFAAACAGSATRLPLVRPRAALAVSVLLTAVLAGVSANVFATERDAAWRYRGGPGGQPIIDAVARDTPATSIVVALWAQATTLAYGAYVEHALGTRIVIQGWPDAIAADYPAWSAVRPVAFVGDNVMLGDLAATFGIDRMDIRRSSARVPVGSTLLYVVRIRPPTRTSNR